MNSKDIIEKLKLEPLLPEGGYFRRTWYKKGTGSVIYYLIDNSKGSYSELHSLYNAETWHFYLGDSVDLHLFDKTTQNYSKISLGSDIMNGDNVQFTVPKNSAMGAKLKPGGIWALMGTTMAPSFEIEEYIRESKSQLIKQFPKQIEIIDYLTR